MRRPIRIILAILLLLAVGMIAAGFWMMRSAPDWYHPKTLSAAESAAAANQADQEIISLENWAAQVQARRQRLLMGGSVADNPPIGPFRVIYTDDQLNAWVQSWAGAKLQAAAGRMHADSPSIFLSEGSLILAAHSQAFGSVLSGRCTPGIGSDGKLSIDWGQFQIGRLPAPQSLISPMLDSAIAKLQTRAGSIDGHVDADGSADRAAMETVLNRMFQNTLNHQPSDPDFFILSDLANKRGTSVRITAVRIDDGSITLTLEPDDADASTIRSRVTAAP